MMADVIDISDRHLGRAEFLKLMAAIVSSDNPPLAAAYIAGGICAWLVCHAGVPVEEIHAMIARAIAEERNRRA